MLGEILRLRAFHRLGKPLRVNELINTILTYIRSPISLFEPSGILLHDSAVIDNVSRTNRADGITSASGAALADHKECALPSKNGYIDLSLEVANSLSS